VKDDRVYLQHIRDALDDIVIYANAGRDAFFAERMRQDATIPAGTDQHLLQADGGTLSPKVNNHHAKFRLP
jgi:2-methylisocitrate lyase-like PEP mutase family enzyme